MANLRDRGYPSAKSYVPNRSDKRNTPMTKDTEATFYRGTSDVTPTKSDPTIMDRLITAYNSRMFGNPKAPMLTSSNFDGLDGSVQRGVNVVRHGSPDLRGRLGFVNKSVKPNGDTSYNVGLDNGAPNRGVFEAVLNAPYGRFGGGFEDETNYLSYSNPNSDPLLNAYYRNDSMAQPVEANVGTGASDLGGKMVYADLNAPFINRDSFRQVDTPLGNVSVGTSAVSPFNNGYAYADFTPNQYIQALINLLKG